MPPWNNDSNVHNSNKSRPIFEYYDAAARFFLKEQMLRLLLTMIESDRNLRITIE